MLELTQISYGGWSTCHRLTNGMVELIITGEIGPRLIRFGFVGGPNQFYEDPATLGATGGDDWRIYGGHRLWHAPEAAPRTYFPDNTPITVEQIGERVRVTQPVEPTTGIAKQIDIDLAADAPHVRLVHRLTNRTLWTVELAPWALSVMAGGGVGILPLPPRGSHEDNLLPTSSLALWAYTSFADPRWTLGERFILLRQQPGAAVPQKVGARNVDGWAAYARAGQLFVKQFGYDPAATYPDMGCNFETFTNEVMLEVESLGPVVRLDPGASVEHEEAWSLFADVPAPANDADVVRDVLPRVEQAQGFAGKSA